MTLRTMLNLAASVLAGAIALCVFTSQTSSVLAAPPLQPDPPASHLPHLALGGPLAPPQTAGRIFVPLAHQPVERRGFDTETCYSGGVGIGFGETRFVCARSNVYSQGGGPPTELQGCGSMIPAWFLPDFPIDDDLVAAVVHPNEPVALVARTTCSARHDSSARERAAYYVSPSPGTHVVVPLAHAERDTRDVRCSVVSVQNTDEVAPAQVSADVYAEASGGLVTTRAFNIAAGASVTWDLCRGDLGALPRRFVGAVHVMSVTPVAVQAYVDYRMSDRGLIAFEGVPAEQAATELFVPRFRSRQPHNQLDPNSGLYDTTIAVANPNPDPVDVTIEFRGESRGDACTGKTFTHGPFRIPGRANARFHQGPTYWMNDPVTGQSPLPPDCAGSARIVSEGGPVAAVVVDTLFPGETVAAYNAVSTTQAGRRVALPMYEAFWSRDQLVTGIYVMNLGDDDTVFELAVANYLGESATNNYAKRIAPGEVVEVWPGGFASPLPPWDDPDTAYGSVVVTADQPLAVVVHEDSVRDRIDRAMYNGIVAEP